MVKHGLRDYHDFLRRSADDPNWFYPAIFDFLSLDWMESFDSVLDVSDGPEWSHWFSGGRTNLAWLSVDRWLLTTPDKAALIWCSEDGASLELTYAQLAGAVSAAATGLRELGVERGDRVGLYLPTIPEAVIAFLAIAKIGAIAVPAFSGYGAEALAQRLALSNAKVLITADRARRRGRAIDLKSIADAACDTVGSVERVVVVEHGEAGRGTRLARDVAWSTLIQGDSDNDIEAFDPATPCLLAFTSGTSGPPKGAVHCHGRFAYGIPITFGLNFDVCADDRVLWPSDTGWMMSQNSLVGTLALGATVVLMEGVPTYPSPRTVWSIVADHAVTHLGMAPTVTRAMAAADVNVIEEHDLRTLRILGSAGEPMTSSPWRWLHRHVGRGVRPIIDLSGGTEAGALLVGSPIVETPECHFSGLAPGIRAEVRDAKGDLTLGEPGEMVVTQAGPSMTLGFWDDAEGYVNRHWRQWPGAWVQGDRAVEHLDGTWQLVGRSDDLIKVAGKRVGPEEYERLACEVPQVVLAVAVGVPDHDKGEAVNLVLEVSAANPSPEEVLAAVRARIEQAMGRAFSPAIIRIVDAIPQTGNGKVNRRAVRELLTSTDPPDQPPGDEEVLLVGGVPPGHAGCIERSEQSHTARDGRADE